MSVTEKAEALRSRVLSTRSSPDEVSSISTNVAQMTIPPRVRGFVIDRESGHPVPGIVVVAVADRDENVAVPVGMLVSDSAGYVSFDLAELHETGQTLRRLWIYPSNTIASKIDIARNCLLAGEDGLHFLLEVDRLSRPQVQTPPSLASVQSPGPADWRWSPHSFSTKHTMALGEDGCATPYPSNFADRDYRFYKVVRRADPPHRPDVGTSGPEFALTGQVLTSVKVDPLGSLDEGLRTTIGWGEVLEFRQRWLPLSHSLGQLSYSLSLAPCESVNLAVVDWSRQDMASRTDQIAATEKLDHDQWRDRNIEETVKAALDESQGGFSIIGALAGAATGLTTGGIAWAATAALGASVAHSSGERNTDAHSTQDLHDHVKQATSATRSLNSTVIMQGTQAEHNALETRTITNHNHCHALTVQYYEVLRNFRLVTTFEGKRPVVLIPFALVMFTWENVLRFRTILERVLLDPALTSCFDAMVRLNLCPDIYTLPAPQTSGTYPGGATNSSTSTDREISQFQITLTTTSDNFGSTEGAISVDVYVQSIGTWETIWNKPKVPAAPELSAYNWPQSGGGKGIQVGDIESLRVGWQEGGRNDVWDLQSVKVTYSIKGEPGRHVLVDLTGTSAPPNSRSNLPALAYFDTAANAPVYTPEYPVKDPPPRPSEESAEDKGKPTSFRYSKVEDACCQERILRHLNGNAGFYNRSIWLLQDPVERRILLDIALTNCPQIRDAVDETPLAATGNYVSFAYDQLVPRAGANMPLPDYTSSADVSPSEDIVSIPTRGLFAEAQLGHCNSCEVRDVTRFWKWEESPCEKAPEIEGITPGPRGQATSVEPANLPSSVVQITSPPTAPDPTGLAAAFGVLSHADLFRDMSGLTDLSHLLSGLSSGAVNLAKARSLASQVSSKVDPSVLNANGAGGSIRGPRIMQMTPQERFDNLQVAKEAMKQASLLGLDAQDKSDLAKGIILGGDQGSSVVLASGVGEALGSAAAKEVADVGAAIIGPITELLKVPRLTIEGPTDAAVLLPGYPNPADYSPPGPQKDHTYNIYLVFDNVGQSGPGEGLQGQLLISWLDDCIISKQKLPLKPPGDRLFFSHVKCKKLINVTGSVAPGGAVATGLVQFGLIEASIEGMLGDDPRATASLLVGINVTPKTPFGSGAIGKFKIPLDPDGESLWVVADNPRIPGTIIAHPEG